MPSSEQNVQECDATDDDSSTVAGPQIQIPPIVGMTKAAFPIFAH